MRVIDINFSDILLEKKIESISIYDIWCYLVIFITKFVIGLNILKVKKEVLQIVLIIFLQKSELIHIIL